MHTDHSDPLMPTPRPSTVTGYSAPLPTNLSRHYTYLFCDPVSLKCSSWSVGICWSLVGLVTPPIFKSLPIANSLAVRGEILSFPPIPD